MSTSPSLVPRPTTSASPASPDRSALSQHIDHPSGFLALSPRNLHFSVPRMAGFIPFRRQGRYRLVSGGVHAPADCRGELLDAFLRDSTREGEAVVALQVRARDVALFRSRGFRVDAFGSTFALALGRFTFAGTKRMKLRNRIKRARDAGVTVAELGRDRACPPGLWPRLREISRAWLATKGGHELDLLVGEMGEPRDPDRRVFVAFDRQGRQGRHERPLGFITYVPVWGERPGVLHDLTRRVPDAPTGVMEVINAVALARFQAEGIPFLHFGFTPFLVGLGGAAVERPDHWLVPRLVRFIGRWGSAIYPARTQLQYKQKWAPEIAETEYIAFQEVSLGALFALLIATRSLVLPWRKAIPAQEAT
jgi:lysylphosphatidylglycerol synthetase-like protein (DUF2156 family)